MGSILGVCLFMQIVSGLWLSFFYSSNVSEAFDSVVKIMEEVQSGWLIRYIHVNGASLFFIFAYLHMARGMYFGSYASLPMTWISGVIMYTTLMGVAFLGYVLPWGQMSFWGATVITNLLSSLPWGESITMWVWGGFTVGGPTLSRFFSLHFILPFVLGMVALLHLISLHKQGSSNPLGVSVNGDKVYFHPLFSIKDLIGLIFVSLLFGSVILITPDLFSDPDNSMPANPMVTPVHIQPEWYFLFAYAILRSIPSKLGGVICMMASILILFLPPVMGGGESCKFNPIKSLVLFMFMGSFLYLTWVGSMPAEGTMVWGGRAASVLYFSLFISFCLKK